MVLVNDMKKAVELHQAGQLESAKILYTRILEEDPEQPDALHLFGVCVYQMGLHDQALRAIQRAIKLNGHNPIYYNNLGTVYKEIGNIQQAAQCFQAAIQLNRVYAEAYYNLGGVYYAQKKFDLAIENYKIAVSQKPHFAEAFNNLAAAYNSIEKYHEAASCAKRALKIKPDYADAYNNLGNAIKAHGALDEARGAYRKAIELSNGSPDIYCNLGNLYFDQGDVKAAVDCYRNAIEKWPEYGKAYNNLGIVFRTQRRMDQSLAHFKQAITLMPADPEPYHNMGNVLYDLEEYEQAGKWYEKALSIDPNLPKTLINLGILSVECGQSEKGVALFRKAMSLDPDSSKACAHLVHALYNRCDWSELETLNERLDGLSHIELKRGLRTSEMPFLSLIRTNSPETNYRIAKRWSQSIAMGIADYKRTEPAPAPKSGKPKLTIAYLSNNFRNHPTAHLINGIFKYHDKARFNIHVYSYGPDDNSDYRRKVIQSAHRFVDICAMDHSTAARTIANDGVDILIDLVGYMWGNRLQIAAMRPAPVQVRWLGLAGTTGADFFDYQITDEIVTPETEQVFYSEKFVYMPDCYQVNSQPIQQATGTYDRKTLGLPEQGIVYSCFCSSYKIDPVIFDAWMEILKKVPRSVLWLISNKPDVRANLGKEARRMGVDPKRLIFSEKIEKTDHLKRLTLADLSLDTRIVNGAATTSDSLFAGVPVVTLKGDHFASRMSASILRAIGLEDLVCQSLTDYKNLAIRLGCNLPELEALKSRLIENRGIKPLFDTQRFVTHLERAFWRMWDLYSTGRAPESIRINGIDS